MFIKGSVLEEYSAHQPIKDYYSMKFEFPNEDMMVLDRDGESKNNEIWTLVFDGASNFLGHGVRVILISPNNQFIPFTTRLCILVSYVG